MNFIEAEKKVIDWIFRNNYETNSVGMKYVIYIISNRIIGNWNNEKITYEYRKTGKYFNVNHSTVQNRIASFREKNNITDANKVYLKKIFEDIKNEI